MLTRRTALAGAGTFGACVTSGYAGYRLGLSASAPEPKTTVKFAVMPNACDAHVHVIGDTSEFPMSPDP